MSFINRINRKVTELFGDSDVASVAGLDLSGLTSITEILPYREWNDVSRLYVNNKSCGFILEMSPLVGADETVVNTITGLVTDGLPKGTCVQIIGWRSRFIGHILEHWARPRLKAGGIHAEMAKSRVAYLSRGAWSPISPQSNMLLGDFRVIIAVSFMGQLTQAREDQLVGIREHLIGTLKGIGGVATAIVEPSALISIVQEWLEPNERDERTPGLTSEEAEAIRQKPIADFLYRPHAEFIQGAMIHDQMASSEMRMTVHPGHIDLGGGSFECRTFSVANYPRYWAQWMMSRVIGHPLNPFATIKCPFRMTLSFRILDQSAEGRHATVKTAKTSRDLSKNGDTYQYDLAEEGADWRFANAKLKEGQKMVRACFTVDIWARKKNGEEAERAVKNLFQGQGWKLERVRYMQLPMFLLGFPHTAGEGLLADLDNMKRTRRMVSWTLANIAPLQGEQKGSETPHTLWIGRRGQLFTWSPFDNKGGNHSAAYVGRPGAGKSVLLQETAAGVLALGGRVRIIDDGRSAEKGAKLQRADVIEFSEKNTPEINPFLMLDRDAMHRDPEYKVDALNFIKLVIGQMIRSNGQVNEYEAGIIEKMIREEMEAPTLRDAVTGIPFPSPHGVYVRLGKHEDLRVRDMAVMMESFSKDGNFGIYVNRGASIDLTNPMVLFELSEIKGRKELQSIVLMLAMFLVSEEMYRLPRNIIKLLIIDEAWDLLHGEGSAAFIEAYVRRCRKYRGSLITGTQSVDDYFKTSGGAAAFNCSDYVVLLPQKQDSIARLVSEQRLAINEHNIQAIKSLKVVDGEYSEAFVKGPDTEFVGRIVLDPISYATFSSKGSDYEAVEAMLRDGATLDQAIRVFAEKIDRQRMAA
ncbi:type IV secretion system protein TraC [Nitrospirillum amazonense]|uniref:type IV secretion system protein TraC n=1 Tax=Nitrospirillum amazonense TaxID=28077 RepID=UPI0024124FF5|nr:type IV secretion system protein TraC [Nitrospirillum amazonense]MDG3444537.1 type IV secretion system protein TraC [Nitrospirillum amazonense]